MQVPDVVEWNPDTQTHSIVSPTLIVDVLLPLCESTNDMPPPGPTWTVRTAAPGGVGVGVGLPGADVGVIVGAPGPDVGVSVGAPGPDVGVAVAPGPAMVLLSSLHDHAASTATATAAVTKRLRIMEHLRG